jgi:tetratricopeptide (TPR) repeat protein
VIPERERALGQYQRAWKLHPDNLKALSRAREVYAELGRHEMVAKLGEMELKSPAASAELPGIVGEALLDSGQRDKATAVLERAVERTPEATRVKDALAALQYDPEFWLDEVERLTSESAKFDDATAARMLLRAARILRLEAADDPSFEATLRAVLAKDLDEPSANVMLEAVLAGAQRWDDVDALYRSRAEAAGSAGERADRYRGFALVWLQRFKDRDSRGALRRAVAHRGRDRWRAADALGGRAVRALVVGPWRARYLAAPDRDRRRRAASPGGRRPAIRGGPCRPRRAARRRRRARADVLPASPRRSMPRRLT